MIWEFIQHAFAGMWGLIVAWTLGSSIVAALLVAALAPTLLGGIPVVGPFILKVLQPLRIDLLLAAVGVAGALVWGAHMQALEKSRCVAQKIVVTKYVTKIVQKAQSPKVQKEKDPYDSPSN